MDINALRCFVELAKTKNFTQAAQNCTVTQPGLSYHIRRLEKELKLNLVKRLPRGAELTAIGNLFLPAAQALLAAYTDCAKLAEDLHGNVRGMVKIVSLPSACVYVLPQRIARFRVAHPHIDIVLEERISADIPDLVRSGAFDLGVTQTPHPVQGISRAVIHEEKLLLAVPGNHPLAEFEEAELYAAAHESFVVTKPDTEFRNLATELCGRAGFTMQAAFEADHFDSLQAYCAVGMGVALIPESVVLHTLTPKPKYLRITYPEAKRQLSLLWPESGVRNQAAQALIPYLKSPT